jgi:hypothetical protein
MNVTAAWPRSALSLPTRRRATPRSTLRRSPESRHSRASPRVTPIGRRPLRARARCRRETLPRTLQPRSNEVLYSFVVMRSPSPPAFVLLLAAACTPAKPPVGACVRPTPPPPASGVGLGPDDIRKTLRANGSCFRACYEARALEDPSLRGGVRVAFSIEPDGSVSSSRAIDSTIHDDVVVACVVKAVASATFPASGGKTNVQFPFVFWHKTPRRAD